MKNILFILMYERKNGIMELGGEGYMGRLGRPKAKKTVTVGIRLTEVEAANLRRIAIAEDITMSEFVRQSINRRMKRLKELGQWTMETERGR